MSDMDLQRVTESMSYIGHASNQSVHLPSPSLTFCHYSSLGCLQNPIRSRITLPVQTMALYDALTRPASIGLHYDPRRRAAQPTRLKTGYDARAPGSDQLHRVKDGSLRTMRKQWLGNQVGQVIQGDAPKRRRTCAGRGS